MNRVFPGDRLGTPTQMIAHYIEEVLMPLCGYSIDLHSGGTSLFYLPTLLRGRGHTPQEAEKLKMLQRAFDLPYAWVFTSGGGPNTTARTSMGAAGRKGVIPIMAELGGGGTVTPEILSMTESGLRRILCALGMLPGYAESAPLTGTRELNVAGSIYAYHASLFEPYKDIGDDVDADDEVGAIHHPDEPWREADTVLSPYSGMVLCKRHPGQVTRGDAVYQIASDAS
jgi:predicted deacylase